MMSYSNAMQKHFIAQQQLATIRAITKPYTIRAGDTLSSIAARELGSAHLWPLLWEYNKPLLQREQRLPGRVIRYMKGPDWIFPGTTIELDVMKDQA